MFPPNRKDRNTKNKLKLTQESTGILISIDLIDSSKLKYEQISNSEKTGLYTQSFYQHNTKVYYHFLQNLCRNTREYLDQIHLIKNLGDEFWLLAVIPSEEQFFLKDLLHALKEVKSFQREFLLQTMVSFRYRVYADFFPKILTFQKAWNHEYSEFIEKFFDRMQLNPKDLADKLERYSNNIGNLNLHRKSPTNYDSLIPYDPFGTEIDLFFRCSAEAKKLERLYLGENLFKKLSKDLQSEDWEKVLLYNLKGFGNKRIPVYVLPEK